jgi:DNA-binding NtrC family response regulator
LYYRLSAFVLNLPPLKERKSELPFLIDYFRLKVAQQLHLTPFDFDEALVTAACAYPWPGNLRELINFIQRITIFRDRESALSELGKLVSSKSEPLSFPASMISADKGMKASTYQARMQVERDLILRTLNSTGWNRKHAAGHLKISYKTLLGKIREYGLEQARIPA